MIDVHLHLQSPRLAERLDEIVGALRQSGVRRWVVNGTSPDDWAGVAALSERFEEVVPFYAVHPWRQGDLPTDWDQALRRRLESRKDAGIGETGLDRWIRPCDFERQRDVFLAHLELAREYHRVLSIHCLRAWGHLLESLEQAPPSRPFLIHSYSGPAEMVPRFAEMGAYFSISGYFFRHDKREKLEVFSCVPEHLLLLETDAPDMAPPEAMRRFPLPCDASGQAPNHPANLVAVYEAFARWKRIPFEAAVETVAANARTWLGCG